MAVCRSLWNTARRKTGDAFLKINQLIKILNSRFSFIYLNKPYILIHITVKLKQHTHRICFRACNRYSTNHLLSECTLILNLSDSLSVCLSPPFVCLYIYLSIYLSTCLSVRLSIYHSSSVFCTCIFFIYARVYLCL